MNTNFRWIRMKSGTFHRNSPSCSFSIQNNYLFFWRRILVLNSLGLASDRRGVKVYDTKWIFQWALNRISQALNLHFFVVPVRKFPHWFIDIFLMVPNYLNWGIFTHNYLQNSVDESNNLRSLSSIIIVIYSFVANSKQLQSNEANRTFSKLISNHFFGAGICSCFAAFKINLNTKIFCSLNKKLVY